MPDQNLYREIQANEYREVKVICNSQISAVCIFFLKEVQEVRPANIQIYISTFEPHAHFVQFFRFS